MTAELKHIKIKIFINIEIDQLSDSDSPLRNENLFAVKANGLLLERNNKILTKQIIITN